MLQILSYLAADQLALRLPVPAAEQLGVAIARVAFALPLPARRFALVNQSRLGGSGGGLPASRRARQSFEHFALALVDFLRLARLEREQLLAAVEVSGAEHLAAARAGGRGVVLLSAHVGGWEWGAAWLAAQRPRLHLLARPHPSRPVEGFFARRRARWGVQRLVGRPLWVRATRALRRGEWVAVMGDRAAAGVSASACAWAAAVARRSGATLLPGVMVRTGSGRYAAHFAPALDPGEDVGPRYRELLAGWLARHAAQWCAFEPLPEPLA
jgi:KDO2-lipid IV(A) lauroyltransferase